MTFYNKMSYLHIDENGTKSYYYDSEIQKEYLDGTIEWYLNSVLHRENKPAVIKANGDKYWYKNGLLHRLNGPAIIYKNGTVEWYLDGKTVCKYF